VTFEVLSCTKFQISRCWSLQRFPRSQLVGRGVCCPLPRTLPPPWPFILLPVTPTYQFLDETLNCSNTPMLSTVLPRFPPVIWCRVFHSRVFSRPSKFTDKDTHIMEIPCARTVKPRATATRSYNLSIDTTLEVAWPKKPEVAPKPVIVRQPSLLVGALFRNTNRQRIFVSAFGWVSRGARQQIDSSSSSCIPYRNRK